MPHKLNIAAVALLGLSVVHDLKTQITAAKAGRLYLAAAKHYEEVQAANHEQIDYLIHVLEKNGIAPDEFDMIALNYHFG